MMVDQRFTGSALACAVLVVACSTVRVCAEVGANGGVLNPNQASREQLESVPHLNATLVKQILDARPFLGMPEVHALVSKTLTPEQCAEAYVQMFIPLNLNQATRPEILLVPGVGKRMAHEFEEYRPYEAMARFRREIGKGRAAGTLRDHQEARVGDHSTMTWCRDREGVGMRTVRAERLHVASAQE